MFRNKMFKKVCYWCILSFLLIFTSRLFYQGFYEENHNVSGRIGMILNSDTKETKLIKNYATEKLDYAQDGTALVVNQKYEKIANLSSNTEKYDEDEEAVYGIIENQKCMIQLENKSGLKGNRRTDMVIGVKPDYFDETINQLKLVGKGTIQNITKSDKTAEYRQMLANKTTLEKTKESYIALRAKGGSITELMTLEQKLIEIEGQIQQQSVDLGDYSDENAFCTVNFTLQETSQRFSLGNIIRFLWDGFTWTIKVYLVLLGVIFLTMIFALAVVYFFNRGKKLLSNINEKIDHTSKEE